MITIIDYGVGNLKSVQNAFLHLGYNAIISDNPDLIKKAPFIVLPGQGAFKEGLSQLTKMDLIDPIKNHITTGKPYLGICLGFQLLFEDSEEDGYHKGFGLLKGTIKSFDPSLKTVPHMGWNTLDVSQDPLGCFSEIKNPISVYFANSFCVENNEDKAISTLTSYSQTFVSSVQFKNCFATQFHPEKSGETGLKILDNFCSAFG
jgi:imidazole glycerol-phosphate synthase subunit HisH